MTMTTNKDRGSIFPLMKIESFSFIPFFPCRVLFYCMWLIYGGFSMAASGSDIGNSSRTLDETPTWAVAAVCTVFILISIALEKSLHKLGTWLGKRQKKALLEALEKVKAELMVLGFISLLLTIAQSYIVRICISEEVANKMLPCPNKYIGGNKVSNIEEKQIRNHRYLSVETTSYKCTTKGHEPLLSVNGLHQLHILIFFLAVFHVFYSAVTMLLGRLKIRGWKKWEEECSDATRFRLTHETSFVRAHTSFWTRASISFYIGCFIRQFYRSVRKVDYRFLRNGFINVHLAPGSKFNFQKYIKRSLEDDFKVVVGVSPVLWASAVVFLLLNIDGWRTPLWAFLIPIIIILAVGTKLQVILARMALEISDRHVVVLGMPLVQSSDRYFWFNQPQFLLHLIHFALFQNSFQITYILWTWYSFGVENCLCLDHKLTIMKVACGIVMLCLCSYITLPLYALVTQMGSRMKRSIFDEQTSKALKKWHMTVKKKHGVVKLGKSKIVSMDGSSTIGSTMQSPSPALHRFKTTGHSTRSSTFEEHDEYELSDHDMETNLILRIDEDQESENVRHNEGEANNTHDFNFFKHTFKSFV
ncbi:MLO-like protein 10 isoform X2 [Vicia villosa]|uniref:MLO-like protein 10 isoform X2 n=1 Tax=Vicia villosa TaxID=3911 RepID=UPI00273B94E9|nr:MLO-like protein 10 isoform X2 [Vicia villosa]